jgi:hypothetical protein
MALKKIHDCSPRVSSEFLPLLRQRIFLCKVLVSKKQAMLGRVDHRDFLFGGTTKQREKLAEVVIREVVIG